MTKSIRYGTATFALASMVSLGAVAMFASPASAQSTTTTPAATSTTKDATQAARHAAHTAQREADLADLAGRLGVTKEKLVQALKDQAKADIDKAVAAGKISAADAVTMKAAIDAGTGGKHGGKHGGGPGGGSGGGRGGKSEGTTSTPPTAAERKAAHDARDAEFAARLGVTKEKLVQARKDQAKARVDAKVAAGELTAAQGATVKQAIDQDIPGVGGHGGKGGGHGHGGGGHGGGHR